MGKMSELAISLEEAEQLLTQHGRSVSRKEIKKIFILKIIINGFDSATVAYPSAEAIEADIEGAIESCEMSGSISSSINGDDFDNGFGIEEFIEKVNLLKPLESTTFEVNDFNDSIKFKVTCLEFYNS